MVDKDTGEIKAPLVRTRYNYDSDLVSLNSAVRFTKPTRTKQQFKEEVDINTIVRNFGLTGELPKNVRVPQSGDFTGVSDFQSAMNIVRQAEEAFMQLPAETRARFNNDPQLLQQFVEDRNNLEEARKLGLAVPAPVEAPPPAPMAVRIVENDPPAPSPAPAGNKGS